MSFPFAQEYSFTVPGGTQYVKFEFDVWTYVDAEPSTVTTSLLVDGVTTICETTYNGNANSGATVDYLMSPSIWNDRKAAGLVWRNGGQGGGYLIPPKVASLPLGAGDHTVTVKVTPGPTGNYRALCVKDFTVRLYFY